MLVACIAIMLPNLGKAATTANLLLNPGFEEPYSGGYIPGWTTSGDVTTEIFTTNSPEGQNHMALTSDDLGVGDLGGFYQDVDSVSAGTEYTISAQIGTYGYSLDTVTILKIEWFSSGGLWGRWSPR